MTDPSVADSVARVISPRRRRPTGPTPHAEARRAEIVRAAHEIFAMRGFRSGSLAEIADRVGMTHQGILHYFGSKEKLLLEVLEARDRGLFDDGHRPTGRAFLQYLLGEVAVNVHRSGLVSAYAVLSAESVTEEHPAQQWFRHRFTSLRAELSMALAELTATSSGDRPTASELDRAAAAIVAVMDGLQVQWLLDPDAIDMVTTVRTVINLQLAVWAVEPLI